MSQISKAGISRRGFLKVSAVGAAGLASAGAMTSAKNWLAPAPAIAEPEEKIACTFHQSHCAGMCSLRCTVRDGRLVKIEPNHCSDERYETVCLKGLSEVQHIYADDRIQTPLKLTGERGSNSYEPVSWDEALDDICSRIKGYKESDGANSVLLMQSGEAEIDFHYLSAILGCATVGGENQGIDTGYGSGHDQALGGLGYGYSMCTSEPRDWVNSKLVLTVGSNFLESSLTSSREFFEAKEAGARMVTVDPHFSTTASKSNEWIPIEPGTDAALFLGMISYILDNDLANKDFVLAHTSLPFLVDTATGKMVRAHEPVMVTDATTGTERAETSEENSFFVIDANGAAVPFTEGGTFQLSGEVDYEGMHCKTAWDLLVENQKPYTLDWASSITSIPAEKIAEIAKLYAEGPAAIAFGWGGGDKMGNADIAGHATVMLTSITGNIGKPGTGSGVWLGPTYSGYSASLGAWALPEGMAASDGVYDLRYCRDAGLAPKALVCVGDNPAQYGASMNKTKDWFNLIDFIVVVDPYFHETSNYADYILPATTRFEYDEEVGNVHGCYNQIGLQEKVVEPLFEAKTGLWIEREFAKRFGYENALPSTAREYCDAILSTSTDPYYNTLTVDQIVENNGVWPMQGIEKPRMANTELLFPTPSTRLEPYYENMIQWKQAVPSWEPCLEATVDNSLRATYPLQFSNVRSRFYIHDQFYSAAWTKQYHTPHVELNPKDMESRGLANEDVVEVFNDRGSFKVKVAGNPSVRPGSARIIEGATSRHLIEGNLQNVTNDTVNERDEGIMLGAVTPFSDTLVEVRKA